MMVSNRNLPFQGLIFRFHVKLRGSRTFGSGSGSHNPQSLGECFHWLLAWGFSSSDLGCPVGFGRLKGDRINGLFHLLINEVYYGVIAH